MKADEIVSELKSLGSESIKKILMNHGAREPFFGVKVEHLKKIQKRIKKNYELALELYATGISDAMYLAGLIADDEKMTKKQLQLWAEEAYWYMLSEYTVPWVAASGPHGWDMGQKWIGSKKEGVAAAGWSTFSNLVSMKPDEELDIPALSKLLSQIPKEIHKEANRVRYTMNGFVISLGAYVNPLSEKAVQVAEKIGPVTVEMGGTSCKVPSAPEYIEKAKARGSLTKKKKTCKC